MKKLNLFAFLPFGIFALVIIMFIWGMYGKRVDKDLSPMIGKGLPTISAPTLDGQVVNVTSVSSPPLIINFFASWCAPCREEHKQLIEIAKEYNYQLIGVAYRDDPKDTQKYIDELGNPYDYILVDRQGAIGASLGMTGVPETYIVGSNAAINYKHKGPISPTDVKKILKYANQ
jgi:cytochrome c biogenesis protein CcmG, thiol:disulfide interchange protein DsbE